MTHMDDAEDRARKERSPSYPFISLPRAIDRARVFSEAHRRNPARLAMVADTWGYAPSSSGLLQTASALKAYGLLEDLGRGSDRKIQLTDLAQHILYDTRDGAKESAIKEAALRPRLFAEYAEKWLPNRPSDNHCLSELTLDRGFTEAAAKLFLRSFDDTATFANLASGDNLSPGSQGVEIHVPAIESKVQFHPPTVHAGRPAPLPAPLPAAEPFRVSFTGSGIEVIARLTDPASADDLIRSIEALKLLLRPASDAKKPETE